MDKWDTITGLLGIQEVIIRDVKLFKSALHAVIYAELPLHNSFCKTCGCELSRKPEWYRRELSGPPLGVFRKVTIRLQYARAWCESCRHRRYPLIPWIHPHFESMTCGFAETAGRLMEETTCEATDRLLRHGNSKMLWSLDQWRMEHMFSHLELPQDAKYFMLSADEVHFKTERIPPKERCPGDKRQIRHFITNLVAPEDGKVLFNAPGRDSESLETCLLALTEEQRLGVGYFSCDMHEPYIAVARTELPNAFICLDRFHLMKNIHERFDRVRKLEFRKAAERSQLHDNEFIREMLRPHKRFLLVSRPENLSEHEEGLLKKLRRENRNIHDALLIIEQFRKTLDCSNILRFRKNMAIWYRMIGETKLVPFREFRRKIIKYRKMIERYVESGLTTAVSEGLNRKIKTLKNVAYGYQNERSFRNKILQRCGYLNSNYMKCDHMFFTLAVSR